MQNRNIGLRSYNSNVTSINWDSTSTGNVIGIAADGGVIRQYGTQPYGSSKDKYQTNGGVITNYNGTQISDIISSGLSCTWGTITGGYVRHGNAAGGAAMITVTLSVTTTTTLSSGTIYSIAGFPQYVGSNNFAVAINKPSQMTDSFFGSTTINIRPNVSLVSGTILLFNCTYLTNS